MKLTEKLTEEEKNALKKSLKAARLCGMGGAFKESLRKSDIDPKDFKEIIGEEK